MVKGKYILLILVILPLFVSGQVPDNYSFNLTDVTSTISGTQNNLIECFDESNAKGFDPSYVPDNFDPDASDKSGYQLRYFRNYHDEAYELFSPTYSYELYEDGCTGIYFKPDGTRFYVITNDNLKQYSLSTAWDISGGVTFEHELTDLMTQEATGIEFKPDGTRFYYTSQTGDNGSEEHKIGEYHLSTAWDISTASFDNVNSLPSYNDFPSGIRWRGDGFGVSISDGKDSKVRKYVTDSGWTISDGYDFFDETGSELTDYVWDVEGFCFADDGYKLFVVDQGDHEIEAVDLEFNYNVGNSGDSHYGIVIDDLIDATNGECCFVDPNGFRMWVLFLDGTLQQYETN